MAAGTTSATTFKLRVGPETGYDIYVNGISGVRLFGGVQRVTMIIEELAP
jgi:hypothetical protein